MSEIETKTGADPRPPDPRRRSPWGAVGGGLVGGLGALLAVSAAGPLLREVKQSLTLPVVGAWVVGGPLFGLATHELGHLIAGRLVGFQFHMFVLGPLRVQRESSGRIGLYLNRDLTSYGGLAGMVPVETAGLARRFAGFVAGGPLMSFGLAALGLGLGYGLPGLPPLGRLGLSWLGASCGLVCLMTVLPLPNGAFLTDGARLLQYWRGGPRAGRDAALLYLIAQSNAEVPPARWDPSAVATVLSPADGSMFEASGRMMAYLFALDTGDVPAASDHFDRAMALRPALPAIARPSFDVEAAYFEAARRGRPDVAAGHLGRVPERAAGVARHSRLTAMAALQIARGDAGAAALSLDEAERHAPPTAAHDRRRIAELRERLERPDGRPDGLTPR